METRHPAVVKGSGRHFFPGTILVVAGLGAGLLACGDGEEGTPTPSVGDTPTVDCLTTLPRVSITAPEAYAELRPGSEIQFAGTVSDAETLDFTKLKVEMVLTGELDRGGDYNLALTPSVDSAGTVTASVDSLDEGSYSLAVSVTDFCDQTSRDSLDFSVVNAAPTITVETTSGTDVKQGGKFTVTGFALDEDDLEEELVVTLIDDTEFHQGATAIPEADGFYSLTVTMNSIGVHTITVLVADPNEEGASTEPFTVNVVLAVPLPI